MRRIPVENLYAGLVLQKPLYDTKNVLLLAPGKQLTKEMVASLRSAGHEFAFIGDGAAPGTQKEPRRTQVATLRQEAERQAVSLQQDFDRLRATFTLEPASIGRPMQTALRTELRTERRPEDLARGRKMVQDAEGLLANISEGEIHDDEVMPSALKVAELFAETLCADPSQAMMLSQTRRSERYLYAHSTNVALLAMRIGVALGYNRAQVIDIGTAALLQDLGMAMAPAEILSAERTLSLAEMALIKKHAGHGLFLLDRFRGAQYTARFVAMQCHERNDGSGYPGGHKKAQIHRYARIVAVADTYDALISDRPWRKALHPYDALERLIRWAHAGTYDGEAVRGLLQAISLYPIGSFVELSTREIARVVHPNGVNFGKPTVLLLMSPRGRPYKIPEFVNLSERADISIQAIVHEPPANLPLAEMALA